MDSQDRRHIALYWTILIFIVDNLPSANFVWWDQTKKSMQLHEYIGYGMEFYNRNNITHCLFLLTQRAGRSSGGTERQSVVECRQLWQGHARTALT